MGGAVTRYEYDAENKLVQFVSSTGTTANYKYDGLGRRVEKEVITGSTTTTRYVYDNEDILLELNGANAIVARYTHGPGIDEPLIMDKNGQSFFTIQMVRLDYEITNKAARWYSAMRIHLSAGLNAVDASSCSRIRLQRGVRSRNRFDLSYEATILRQKVCPTELTGFFKRPGLMPIRGTTYFGDPLVWTQ